MPEKSCSDPFLPGRQVLATGSTVRSAWLAAGLLLLCCVVWLLALDARTLVPTDEARYAEMSREMAVSGDFITPRLNGIKYFEKPPLQIWMTALAFKAFGVGEWQARLWTGLCGLFGIFLTAWCGMRLFGRNVGIAAGAVLASCLYWGLAGHINSLDMGLAAMMTLALCGFLLAQRRDATAREQRNWMLACWAGMALAVLSKGLIGVVLPGAVLALHSLAARDWALWRRLHIGLGLVLFFAITAPWFILVSLANPEFPHFFFIHEHFQRFTSNVHGREGAWYYFIPLLLAGLIPWLTVFPQSLRHALRQAMAGSRESGLLLIWAIFIFLFFSLSGSKLPSYILPVFPALALLLALYLKDQSGKALRFAAVGFFLCCLIGLVGVLSFPLGGKDPYELPRYQAYLPWEVGATLAGMAGAALALWIGRKREWDGLAILAATAFLVGQALLAGHEPLGRYKAGLHLVPAIQKELGSEVGSAPIYAVDLYEQALPFYLGRTLTLVASAGELEFGLRQEPALWLPTFDSFTERWQAERAGGRKALAIMRPNTYAAMKAAGLPMQVIAQDSRRIIVTNIFQQ